MVLLWKPMVYGCWWEWLPWIQGQDSGDRGHKVRDDEDGHLIYQEGDILQARCTCHFVMFSLGLLFLAYVPCFYYFVHIFYSCNFLFRFLYIFFQDCGIYWSMFYSYRTYCHQYVSASLFLETIKF